MEGLQLFNSYLSATSAGFAENLRTTVYGNGDVIPAGLSNSEWTTTASSGTVVYGEGNSNCTNNSTDIDACDEAQSLAEYGRLVQLVRRGTMRAACALVGWHVPTDGEWTDLERLHHCARLRRVHRGNST